MRPKPEQLPCQMAARRIEACAIKASNAVSTTPCQHHTGGWQGVFTCRLKAALWRKSSPRQTRLAMRPKPEQLPCQMAARRIETCAIKAGNAVSTYPLPAPHRRLAGGDCLQAALDMNKYTKAYACGAFPCPLPCQCNERFTCVICMHVHSLPALLQHSPATRQRRTGEWQGAGLCDAAWRAAGNGLR